MKARAWRAWARFASVGAIRRVGRMRLPSIRRSMRIRSRPAAATPPVSEGRPRPQRGEGAARLARSPVESWGMLAAFSLDLPCVNRGERGVRKPYAALRSFGTFPHPRFLCNQIIGVEIGSKPAAFLGSSPTAPVSLYPRRPPWYCSGSRVARISSLMLFTAALMRGASIKDAAAASHVLRYILASRTAAAKWLRQSDTIRSISSAQLGTSSMSPMTMPAVMIPLLIDPVRNASLPRAPVTR